MPRKSSHRLLMKLAIHAGSLILIGVVLLMLYLNAR